MSGDDHVTTSLLAGAPSVMLAAVDLHIVDGPDRGVARRLHPGLVRIGTAPSCQLQLSDPTVSRVHCQIRVQPHGFRVTDLDSTNGTFVDGVRIFDAELRGAGTIVVGATALRLELADEPVSVEISRADRFGDVLGTSLEMRRIYATLERVAPTEATVLLQGETGTGKERIARAIHDASPRADGPFVTVDCGAIAPNLIESELFGHVRGAFSGAVSDRPGLVEQADGGTLFLDEIGELPLALQPKLLRALETREVRRVGSNAPVRMDARVVAASNRILARGVNEGTFREDLYYRLAVVEIALPPLRARREDIPLLAQHFYTSFSGTNEALPQELVATMMARAWPGNVRELRNFVERSVSLGWSASTVETGSARPVGVPPGLEALVPADLPLKEARDVWTSYFERLYVSAVLRRTGGNVTRAAELAGVTRRSLQRLMAQQGIRSREVDDESSDD
ncbi:MAG TPA: sigma 54-interacting transcriptional regulator [Polyangiaceae bacterium]|jgi:transcriptional regulator with PAS, ATPase and Fis domain|nr:sigma 54-interacting transcriptional regulator [Polyangiaceae bacterium]